MKNKFNLIRIPLIIFNLIMSILLILDIHKLNILPTKYFLLVIGIIGLINIITIVLLLLKNKIIRIIGIIISILYIILSIIGLNYTTNTNSFLNKAFNNNIIETSTYNVIVLKDSSYNKIEELKNKKLGYLKEEKNPIELLNDIVTTESTEYEDLYELYDLLVDKKIDSMLIDEAYIDVLEDDYSDIDDNIKILYTFNLETEIEKKDEESSNLVRPINIYISGSDSRSNNISNKSRSDVNMIATINPNTNKILLTSIPRDYYVQVHGQTGLKDKLTHSGIYGLEISAKTIEDLFDVKIDYSIKIGMNAVEEVVDLVGGIEIYSDKTFRSYHLPGWTVQEGMNDMDGKKALAYARERYAYASGDRHRIQNQQQVLEAVLKKVLSDKSILLKYDDLLESLSNLYRTDIPRDVITAFVKEQLETMDTWKFETQWVDGKGASLPTHTAPKYKRYVMIPYEEDVEKASLKMKSVLSEK
ncbi:MAG: LCP family protein [Candidatus Coprovivens sp.]